jgi:hypothetical protein
MNVLVKQEKRELLGTRFNRDSFDFVLLGISIVGGSIGGAIMFLLVG